METEAVKIVLQACNFITSLSAAILVILLWAGKAKAPHAKQNERLDALEKWKDHVDKCLDDDKSSIAELREGNRVMQQALLALMQNAIANDDAPDPKLVEASNRLEKFLIER